MTDTINPVAMRLVDESAPQGNQRSSGDSESRKFENLAAKLIQVPKAEIDEKRQES